MERELEELGLRNEGESPDKLENIDYYQAEEYKSIN